MNCESDVVQLLETLLLAAADGEEGVTCMLDDEQEQAMQFASMRTFNEAGLLTSNEGLVLKLRNGAEFQIQIVQSKEARE